jgi:hypothetical protein
MTRKTRLWLAGGVLGALLATGTGIAIGQGTGAPDAGTAPPVRDTVKIVFQTVPPQDKVKVRIGKKVLGLIRGPRKPLIVERPRDSGPLDVTVQAEGFLPVHTRAYTFNDNKVFVKLTPVEEKHTLFGYREELPPEPDAGATAGGPMPAPPDGGVPPAPLPVAPVPPAP